MTAPAEDPRGGEGYRCGVRLPIEHATLVCGRKAGHDGEHRCTRADGSMTGWADIPPAAGRGDTDSGGEGGDALAAVLSDWRARYGRSIPEAKEMLAALERRGYTVTDQGHEGCQAAVEHAARHLHGPDYPNCAAAWAARPAGDRAQPAGLLVELSEWVNGGNADRSPDALLWIRVCKPAEEAGEAISALHAATGANPRKAAVDGVEEVVEELLDTAVAALAAVEHLTGHAGQSLARLDDKIRRVHRRALGVPS